MYVLMSSNKLQMRINLQQQQQQSCDNDVQSSLSLLSSAPASFIGD